jgi:protein SCO1/2
MKRWLRKLSLGCAAALVLSGAVAGADGLKAGVFDPPRAAPAIELAGSNGKAFRLADYRGKVVVLEFGFTHCENVCPVSLAALAQARAQLGAAGAEVQVVFVSVDPERDNPQRLRGYLAQFDPGFIGVTGTPAQVAGVLRNYGINAVKRLPDQDGDYAINHSSYLYFIDRQGRQRAMMPFGRPAADIAHDLAILLKR